MKFDDPTCPSCGADLDLSFHYVVDECGVQVEFDPPQIGNFDEMGTVTCQNCKAILKPVNYSKMVEIECDASMDIEDDYFDVSEEEMSEPLNYTHDRNTITPCDEHDGQCPFDAQYSRDCEFHCGLGR
jgi:NMD protein affecting ribosome stability and mRNA decay